MSVDRFGTAALALHRFGFGPKVDSMALIASDPRGALLAELESLDAGRLGVSGLLSSPVAARQTYQDRMIRRERQQQPSQKGGKSGTASTAQPMGNTSGSDPEMTTQRNGSPAKLIGPPLDARLYFAEAEARVNAALSVDIGLVERLVWFWSNHFCIAAKGAPLRASAGAFEREAIRPYVLSRFADMLMAVESHPAMLLYLDNTRSIGPNSRAGTNRKRGLNENLAREILELHTLGVRTEYSQADVTNFAKVITGWGVVPAANGAKGGEFEFFAQRHEPGPQTVLGKRYPDTGMEQGRAVLNDLAKHPSTARHVATKLATHFVADAPPETLVARLAKRFLDTVGNLKEVTRTLMQSDEAWNAPRAKLKRPSEWMIAAMRTTEPSDMDIRRVLNAQEMLGEPLWQPPSPKGFSDQTSDWVDGIAERLDVATDLAGRSTTLRNPLDLVEQALGPLATEKTQSTVARAEDRTQALTLLFMAPEFQRR